MGARKTEDQIDWERARKLYGAGLFDSEIARQIGCDASSVHSWRRQRGLPKNPCGRMTEIGTLYDQGLHYSDIAQRLGCSPSYVREAKRRLASRNHEPA